MLAEAMPVTLKHPVSKPLQYKGWFLVGNYYSEQEKYTEAIKAYSKARIIKPAILIVFDKLISSADSFYIKNRDLFSKSDLQKFKEAFLPIINYHSINFPKQKAIIGAGERLLNKIDYRIKFEAPDMVETPVSYQVQQIYDALYGDMTAEEVQNEFARLLTLVLREKLKEKKSKKKEDLKKKKKKN